MSRARAAACAAARLTGVEAAAFCPDFVTLSVVATGLSEPCFDAVCVDVWLLVAVSESDTAVLAVPELPDWLPDPDDFCAEDVELV